MRRLVAILGIVVSLSLVDAQAATERENAEKELFRKVVEIPTVAGRGEMPRLVKLLSAEFERVGIKDITVKSHGDTQSMIVRWPAARPYGKKPILLMAHMDVVEAKRADWINDPFEVPGSRRLLLGARGQRQQGGRGRDRVQHRTTAAG